jgi:hypothetical protein
MLALDPALENARKESPVPEVPVPEPAPPFNPDPQPGDPKPKTPPADDEPGRRPVPVELPGQPHPPERA